MNSYKEREVLRLLQDEGTQRKGFEMIVSQYSEQLYWQIRRMVLSHDDANDLLQNTFVKAWMNIYLALSHCPERMYYFSE